MGQQQLTRSLQRLAAGRLKFGPHREGPGHESGIRGICISFALMKYFFKAFVNNTLRYFARLFWENPWYNPPADAVWGDTVCGAALG